MPVLLSGPLIAQLQPRKSLSVLNEASALTMKKLLCRGPLQPGAEYIGVVTMRGLFVKFLKRG
jgi:hypothetical protein